MEKNLNSRIEEKIKNILVSQLDVKPATIANCNSDSPLLGRGIGLDSMETLSLVAGIEKEFGIEIPDEDLTMELFKNIGTLTEYIVRKVGR